MHDIRLSEEHHGPDGDRRFDYAPTWVLRGLSELHLEFTPALTRPPERSCVARHEEFVSADACSVSRVLLPGFEEALELELAVGDAAVEQPVAAEHAVLVRRARDVGVRTAGRCSA